MHTLFLTKFTKRLTGEEGYFDTRIIYVSESGPKNEKNKKKLAIMDQDGANTKYLTLGNELVLNSKIQSYKSDGYLHVLFVEICPGYVYSIL